VADTVPGFEQVFSSALFVMPRGGGDVGWCAYLLGAGEPPPGQPISIAQSFASFQGSYLFALRDPAFTDPAQVVAFIAKVRERLAACFGTSRACLWILDPTVPAFGPCGAAGFRFGSSISGTVVQSDFNNPIGAQITFAIRQGAALQSTATGLQIGSLSGTSVTFVTNPINIAPLVTPSIAALPFVGQYSGCFTLAGTLSVTNTLMSFNLGVLYSHGTAQGADLAQIYPVLVTNRSGPELAYIGAIDPLDPLNASPTTVDTSSGLLRTLLAPTTSGGVAPAVASWLRTGSNRAIQMIACGSGTAATGPAAFDGAWVFEHVPGGSARQLYMTFAGDYALQVDGAPLGGSGAGATFELLCGLFGGESMSFRAYATDAPYDRLRFTPRRPAHAPIFPFARVSLENPRTGGIDTRLTDAYRTSWATIANGAGGDARYLAQPESSPLFASSGAVVDGTSVLDVFATGTRLVDEPGFAVPLAAYAGIGAQGGPAFPTTELGAFESQIIAPTRKGLVARSVAPLLGAMKQARLPGATATPATTPQGLLAAVAQGAAGADYVKVTLARSISSRGTADMAFENLTLPLQTLFQTNQLFAVIVNPRHLGSLSGGAAAPGEPAFQNRVTIADWEMAADVGDGVMATDYRNVMIFKFGDGTVLERVANPDKWVQAEDFSIAEGGGDPDLSLTGLSAWLQRFLDAAIAEAVIRNNDLYKPFAAIVSDPSWNGVLVLRAGVERFPDQIRGLAAGVDPTQFEAHHFGVTVSRVRVAGTDITLDGPSSMFGLIDYQYPLYRQNLAAGGNPDLPLVIPAQGAYGFTVLQLQALFRNTALVDFRSRVQLTVNELFGSRVTEAMSAAGQGVANGVVLQGSYQTQGSTSTYVFEQSRATIFTLDSNVFQAVALTRVQFNTLSADTGGASPSVVSRFLIWGSFNFSQLVDKASEPYDVLSFGTRPDAPAAQRGVGLSFNNLQIVMSSPVDTPNAVSFAFGAGSLGYNISASVARDGSLFSSFALQLDSFIASSGDKRPSELGYLSVGTRASLATISGPWFGVVYKVTMGTPGALASGAGFESRLLLAWSPQSKARATSTSVFVGLQLPGAAPGAKLLSLQGVLKVAVSSIQLTYDPVAGTPGVKAFNLRLGNVGLKLLGIVKLPPGATINFFLFGDPGGTGSLGWYAAYVKDRTTLAAPLFGERAPIALTERAEGRAGEAV
jgi:hypothetical protein